MEHFFSCVADCACLSGSSPFLQLHRVPVNGQSIWMWLLGEAPIAGHQPPAAGCVFFNYNSFVELGHSTGFSELAQPFESFFLTQVGCKRGQSHHPSLSAPNFPLGHLEDLVPLGHIETRNGKNQ